MRRIASRNDPNPASSRVAPARDEHRPRAFTLVEVLIAIGIVALLIGILIPVVGRARRAGNAVICVTNLRSLGQGMSAYANAFDGVLPWEGYAEGDRAERHLGPWTEPSTWFNAAPKYAGMQPYSALQAMDAAGAAGLPREGQRSLFICPDAGPAVAGPQDDVVEDGYFMMWGLDSTGTPVRKRTYWCYGYNTQLDEGVEDRHVNYRVIIRLERVRKPAETVLLAEKLMRPDEFTPPFASSVAQQEVSHKEFTTRHNAGGHLLFIDGHVAWFSRIEVLSAPGAPFNYNQPGKIIWNPKGL